MSFDDKIEETIPALFYMFAGSDDHQQSADVNNVGTFTLPDPAGKAGGACTSALLQTLYRDEEDTAIDLSWTETLAAMSQKIKDIGLPQTPQLSSSRMIDMNDTLRIVPDDFDPNVNTKRAMLIGINYPGDKPGELTGCHNDVRNMKDFLIAVCGFEREQMLILMDDGKHHQPTKKMIMDGFHKLVELSEEGDVIFIQFSGHGGQMKDSSGDEEDGYDEILIPGDYKESGQIQDDEIFNEFVTKVRAGVTVTCMIDCCHSGTAMDLPYVCNAGDKKMHRDSMFKIPSSGMQLPTPKNIKKKATAAGKKKAAAVGPPKTGKKASKIVAEDASVDGYGGDSTVASAPEKKKKKGLFGFGKKK